MTHVAEGRWERWDRSKDDPDGGQHFWFAFRPKVNGRWSWETVYRTEGSPVLSEAEAEARRSLGDAWRAADDALRAGRLTWQP